jgi:hypothetical protein
MANQLSDGLYRLTPHGIAIGKALMKVVTGQIRRLIATVPPQHGKSTLIREWFPLFLSAHDPDRKIIYASYEADFAACWRG